MKPVSSKFLVVCASALGGLVLYRLAIRFGETLQRIDGRHPEMGVAGWLLFALWGASAVILGVVSDRLWRGKRLFLDGDFSFAVVFLYMTISALIYLISFDA